MSTDPDHLADLAAQFGWPFLTGPLLSALGDAPADDQRTAFDFGDRLYDLGADVNGAIAAGDPALTVDRALALAAAAMDLVRWTLTPPGEDPA